MAPFKKSPPAIIYLHGLASSPRSLKAVFFANRLRAFGLDFSVPDLNLPTFKTLTLSRAIEATNNEIRNFGNKRNIVLIGSSFGALTALHTYSRSPLRSQIRGLILLAPAFDFLANKEMGPGDVEKWRAAQSVVICHNNQPLNFSFVEDLSNYDSYSVQVEVPCLVVHGRNDQTIGYEQSERFKSLNPQSSLLLLEDVHDLALSLDFLWGSNNAGAIPDLLRDVTELP